MSNDQSNKLAIQRLTALWALSESGLGGIMHAFNSSFSGLVLGSIAVILISLIWDLSEHKWKTLLSALTIVLVIKAAVSPHSNLTAYLAVSFQAIAGGAIYSIIRSIPLGAILFGLIALLESAVQKLIVLYVLYGNTLVEAINEFGAWVSERTGYMLPLTTSKTLVIIYLLVFALGGLISGVFISFIIKSIRTNWTNPRYIIHLDSEYTDQKTKKGNKRKSLWIVMMTIAIMMIALMIYGYYSEGINKGIFVFARTVLILLTWYLFIAPYAKRYLFRLLNKRKAELSSEINHVFDMIPYLKIIVLKAWRESSGINIFNKLYHFILTTILYTLHFKIDE
ncbi:MAG: hypothetical protein KJO50_00090 [Bacteroidia bacterium]|nr:hypothetical protein [Bacteroidia bacterium]